VKHITPADIIASVNYFINLLHQVGDKDDIDHLPEFVVNVETLLTYFFRIRV